MIYPVLPVYLSRVLGAGAFSLGVIEGVADGINSLLRIVSGHLSDRWSRRKPIVIAGYVLSSVSRPLIGMTTGWMQVLAIRAIDRTGKGIRGAPRDAMLAQFATPTTRGRIFGFHRAMDHAGAIVGPLVATAFLFAWPDQYRTLFALTIVPGAIAVWMLFRVPEKGSGTISGPPGDSTDAADPAPAGPVSSERLSRRFWYAMAVLLIFSLGNSADAFLLLRLSSAIGNDAYVPLIWSALHVVKASLSTWGGTLSDRVGRRTVLIAGWIVYALVYVGFAVIESAVALVICFLAYGIYFGLTEGTEKALVADLAPRTRRGTAFGVYNAAEGVGALLASIVFGVLYDRLGHAVAFTTGAALAAAAAVMILFLPADKTGWYTR
jgi:MFS family permease